MREATGLYQCLLLILKQKTLVSLPSTLRQELIKQKKKERSKSWAKMMKMVISVEIMIQTSEKLAILKEKEAIKRKRLILNRE
jgi:hypothetical protein